MKENSGQTPTDKIFVVTPVANEESSIAKTIHDIFALPYPALTFCPIMDRFSKDRTREILEDNKKSYGERLQIVYYEQSTGVASCYLYGFSFACKCDASAIVEMDAGGSHQPNEIPLLMKKLEEGFDCAFGSRFMPGGVQVGSSLYRRIVSRGGTILANIVLGTRLYDMTSGFEAFRADVLRRLDLNAFLSKGHMFQTEMRYYCRIFRTAEVPIHYISGSSTLKLRTVFRSLGVLFRLPFQPNAKLKYSAVAKR